MLPKLSNTFIMEDEECLPENSPLKLYLQNLGHEDVQITKKPQQTKCSLNYDVSKPKSKWVNIESVDEGVIEQIGILISTQMLFEEDVTNIEKFLSNFKVVKTGMMKSMFQGPLSVAVIFFGLCLYWVIGYYAFFIVSSFYAYNAADYLKRRHFRNVRLEKLASILQNNYILLKKTVKFVEENKIFEYNNINVSVTNDFKEGFEFYNNFKYDFLVSLNEMINVLCKSTQKLIEKFPLLDYIENPQFYLCNNLNECHTNTEDLPKLYQIYLLVQSEFLQRLILSLIPNIKVSSKENFREINKLLTETCVNLLKIKNKLNKKFKYIFLNGVHHPRAKVEFKLPPKTRTPGINYAEEFVSNIHDTSNTFQHLLIKSRILEENLKSETIPKNIEDELVNMQNDLKTCQRNIADSFILLKKVNAKVEKEEVTEIKEEKIEEGDENLEKIVVGYSDLDPSIEDDIFEAYFTDETLRTDIANIDDWDFEDRIKKKLEKEYSKKVIKELKTKLIEKAKLREKRERELLRKKNIGNENFEDSETQNETEENESEEEKEEKNENFDELLSKHKNFTPDFEKDKSDNNNSSNSLVFKNILLEKLNEERKEFNEEEPQRCIGVMDKNFFKDLSKAREKILNVSQPNVEEFCYGSEEEEEDEEEDKT